MRFRRRGSAAAGRETRTHGVEVCEVGVGEEARRPVVDAHRRRRAAAEGAERDLGCDLVAGERQGADVLRSAQGRGGVLVDTKAVGTHKATALSHLGGSEDVEDLVDVLLGGGLVERKADPIRHLREVPRNSSQLTPAHNKTPRWCVHFGVPGGAVVAAPPAHLS